MCFDVAAKHLCIYGKGRCAPLPWNRVSDITTNIKLRYAYPRTAVFQFPQADICGNSEIRRSGSVQPSELMQHGLLARY